MRKEDGGRGSSMLREKNFEGSSGAVRNQKKMELRARQGRRSPDGQESGGIFYIIVTKSIAKGGIIRLRSEAGGEFSGPALLFL